MTDFTRMERNELHSNRNQLLKRYDRFRSRRLNLDMARGKPCSEQLDLSLGLLDCVNTENYTSDDGTDYRNYGGLDGIAEAKRLVADYLEVQPDELIVGGNSSLSLMHDTVVRAILHGVVDSQVKWGKLPKIKFLCPAPGYDRHFSMCEYLNIDMIPVELDESGPDMDAVEKLVASDETIRGMWCVPKYSNPTGTTYSDEVVERLARMKTKASDFRIFWDNAYAVHHLTETPDRLKNILTSCKEAGNSERVFIFGSTSKITLPGAGIAMMAASRKNIEFTKKQLSIQTIGPDKINQLRHVRFFRNLSDIESHMKKHAAIIRPKFEAVQRILEKELGGKNIARWSRPNGGYFISLDTMAGCAKKVVEMASAAGVKLTPAGATYPFGNDPLDRNIRIAPTFPPLNQVETATELLAVCVQLASIDKLVAKSESSM
ncbi:MAG: aminotransferase class I/II-fold pyridoxal phosphate-dependent enzyme [Deltaproteobacteria bacterium]|nr:aminotransferase class I/II-fold pyridoxal phosphate-dependent enzyme [Deltaproteobacteria bacterium]MBW2153278.1 aminotransferase class I/II-fold pyridoxal phosphate-dependent enzyme [Deltaproteobacteria bacterium]